MHEESQRYFSMAEAYKKVYQLDEAAPLAAAALKGAGGAAAKSAAGGAAKNFAKSAAVDGAKSVGSGLTNVAKNAAKSMVSKPSNTVGEETINEMPAIMPIRPMGPVVVNRTHVSAEVNPQMQKIGDVEKAYYTFPAGFDPTNREDVAEPMKKSNKTAQESIEIVGDHLLDNGLVAEAEEVDAFYAHMSDEWKQAILEAKIVISPGGKMGRDDKNSEENKGPDIGGMQGAAGNRPAEHSKNDKIAKQAKDPLEKMRAMNARKRGLK